MKKENKFLLINAGIILGVAIVFVVLNSLFALKNPQDLLFNKRIKLTEETVIEEVPSQNNFSIINTHSVAVNRQGNKVGDVYLLKIANGFPSADDSAIDLLLGIDLKNHIHVQFLTLNQTPVYHSGIQDFVFRYLQDVLYTDVQNIKIVDVPGDLTSGPTEVQAHISKGGILELVNRAVDFHFNEEESHPLSVIFTDIARTEEDTTFVKTSTVTKKEVAYDANDNTLGHIYTVTDAAQYNAEGDTGSITLLIGIDLDGKIAGTFIPLELYQHSGGAFRNRVITHLASLEGMALASLALTDNDIVAGSTYSTRLVNQMFMQLQEALS